MINYKKKFEFINGISYPYFIANVSITYIRPAANTTPTIVSPPYTDGVLIERQTDRVTGIRQITENRQRKTLVKCRQFNEIRKTNRRRFPSWKRRWRGVFRSVLASSTRRIFPERATLRSCTWSNLQGLSRWLLDYRLLPRSCRLCANTENNKLSQLLPIYINYFKLYCIARVNFSWISK